MTETIKRRHATFPTANIEIPPGETCLVRRRPDKYRDSMPVEALSTSAEDREQYVVEVDFWPYVCIPYAKVITDSPRFEWAYSDVVIESARIERASGQVVDLIDKPEPATGLHSRIQLRSDIVGKKDTLCFSVRNPATTPVTFWMLISGTSTYDEPLSSPDNFKTDAA